MTVHFEERMKLKNVTYVPPDRRETAIFYQKLFYKEVKLWHVRVHVYLLQSTSSGSREGK
jgi:hypothetical protein